MTENDEKYNEIMDFLGKQKVGSNIYPKEFNLEYDEFMSLINAMENDKNLNKGYWFSDNSYAFHGLTFDGQNFLQNNDKKQYSKIEKTEATYTLNIIHGNNNGNAISGNHNIIHSPQTLGKLLTHVAEISGIVSMIIGALTLYM